MTDPTLPVTPSVVPAVVTQLAPSVLDAMGDPSANKVQHAVAVGVGILAPVAMGAVTAHFGLPPVSDGVLMAIEALLMAFIARDVLHAVSANSVAKAMANAPTPAAAIADLNRGLNP